MPRTPTPRTPSRELASSCHALSPGSGRTASKASSPRPRAALCSPPPPSAAGPDAHSSLASAKPQGEEPGDEALPAFEGEEEDDDEPSYAACGADHPDPLVESTALAAVRPPAPARAIQAQVQQLDAVQAGQVSAGPQAGDGLGAGSFAACASHAQLCKRVLAPVDAPAPPVQISQAQAQAMVYCLMKWNAPRLAGMPRPGFFLGRCGEVGKGGSGLPVSGRRSHLSVRQLQCHSFQAVFPPLPAQATEREWVSWMRASLLAVSACSHAACAH